MFCTLNRGKVLGLRVGRTFQSFEAVTYVSWLFNGKKTFIDYISTDAIRIETDKSWFALRRRTERISLAIVGMTSLSVQPNEGTERKLSEKSRNISTY